jgi:hypothetical protein
MVRLSMTTLYEVTPTTISTMTAVTSGITVALWDDQSSALSPLQKLDSRPMPL